MSAGGYSGGYGGTLNVTSDMNIVLTPSSRYNPFATSGVGVSEVTSNGSSAGAPSTITAQNVTLDMTNGPANVAKIGLGASSAGIYVGKDFTVDIAINNQSNSTVNFPALGWHAYTLYNYGILAGNSVDAAAGSTASQALEFSYVTLDNATINMDTLASSTAGAQLNISAGIRAIKVQGTSGYVTINNNLNINTNGRYSPGVYISGGDSQIHLNNSTIVTAGTLSNALKLGKIRDLGTGSAQFYSTGQLAFDTTKAADTPSILILGDRTMLDANAATSAGTVKSAAQAIEFGNLDLYQRTLASNASASFNNTSFSTTSASASLFQVDAGQTDVALNLRGVQSLSTAAAEGWLIEVQDQSAWNNNPASATFSLSEGATIKGLSTKGSQGSTLNIDMDSNAQWILAAKAGSASSTTATFNQLNLNNQAQLIGYGASDGAANFTLAGNVASNAGILNLSSGAVGDRLTIKGNYVGSGNALLSVDTVLAGDGSASDRLVIDGGAITGNTLVRFNNVGGAGAATEPGHGIKFVRAINGGTTTADAFALDPNASNAYQLSGQTVVGAGAYAYTMFRGANPAAEDQTTDKYGETEIANDWYLRSTLKPTPPVIDPPVNPPVNPPVTPPVTPPVVVPPVGPVYQNGAPTYEAYPQALLGLNELPTLQQRVGNRFWADNGNRVIAEGADAIEPYAAPQEAGTYTEGNGVWGRVVGRYDHMESRFSTTGTDFNQNIFELQAGIDGQLAENENGKLLGGVTAHYIHGNTKTQSFYGDGEISTDGYGFGGTLTWYGNEGFYIDGQAQVTWYNSDLSSRLTNRGLVSGNDGFGYALSLESGKRYQLDQTWSLTPQAQLQWSSVDFDGFTDLYGGDVSLGRGTSLQGRLGLTLDHENSWQNDRGLTNRTHVYGITNLYYEFLNGTRVDLSGVSLINRQDRLWGGLGLGGSYNWDNDKYSIYGEGLVKTSLSNFADSYSLKGTVGFRVKF